MNGRYKVCVLHKVCNDSGLGWPFIRVNNKLLAEYMEWCTSTLGKPGKTRGKVWTYYGLNGVDKVVHEFKFKHAEDAIAFKLTHGI